MEFSQILSTYIKKLCHPLKEIRERSLKLLNAKLKLGWILEDELSGTRELVEALLSWFDVDTPTLQKEALELLLYTIKTKSGNYIVKEFGIKEILTSLNSNKDKVEKDALNLYEDIMDALKFLNTVQSEDNLTVPHLNIPSLTSSETEGVSSSGSYNLACNNQSSKDLLDSREENDVNQLEVTKITDGIKVVLFPWVELSSSDSKTMLLIEDALKLFKSTRRCCRFIRDVFLRDFPPEIFLNRPGILQILLSMSNDNNGVQSEEALMVLLYITRALRKRILQLTSLDLIHDSKKFSEDSTELIDNVNAELEEIAGNAPVLHQEDSMAALKQMPAPLYALDTLHCVLSIMSRSFVLENSGADTLNLKEQNICLNLIENLINLLLDCVTESFWSMEHRSQILKDIAHKSCMMMRLLGDLLTKCRKLFMEDVEKIHLHVVWFRLIVCAEKLLRWALDSALPPSSLTLALQAAQLDPSLDLFYPTVSKKITFALQNSRAPLDQEFVNRYKELNELVIKMDDAVKFMKNKNSCRDSRNVLTCIQNSLPILELHLSEAYVTAAADIILNKCKDLDFNDKDWSIARNIALTLMSHRIEWVQVKFYAMMANMVKSVILDKDTEDTNIEKCLLLLYDVSVLSEICCHGLSSEISEVNVSATEIMLYLLRGRLALSESSWWRLIASLLPILPLLHLYAAHETQIGKAICKSLDPHIAEMMGVSLADVTAGLVRLMFVRCVAVQLDAAHSLCRLLDDDRYLPPKESLRPDVLMNALKRVQPTDFNVDCDSSPSKTPQTAGVMQVLDVLKQDIVLDENGLEFVPCGRVQPALDAALRRSTLQQLAAMMRQPELHDTFLQCDGLRVVVAILRMSLLVDDYLAYPECAISCVSVLNSVCFISRHTLAKIPDLFALLIRVILVFPANESSVSLCAQVLALAAWAAFALQAPRERAPPAPPAVALPSPVVRLAALPFRVTSYWTTSPNAQHSSIEWVLSCEEWRSAARVRWWCAWAGGAGSAARGAAPPPAPLALRPTPRDAATLRAAYLLYGCSNMLLHLENATSHKQVVYALCVLESYVVLQPLSSVSGEEFACLPWHKTQRFLNVSPASPRDTALIISLLQFIIHYMDNVNCDGNGLSWILSSFIGEDATVITLLSRDQLYPQQTSQESIEVTQLHIHIVKVLLRCVLLIEKLEDYYASHLESLLKILLVCLERLDLRNFHVLGYLNELMRCIRYTVNSRHCVLSEETLVEGMRVATRALARAGGAGGVRGGLARKGRACALDALLMLLPILKQVNDQDIPVQRWSEYWGGEVLEVVAGGGSGACARLRAAALHVLAALAHHAPLYPHILNAIPCSSVAQYAAGVFAQRGEASVVRAAAAHLLTALTARTSPHCDILETDVLEQLKENNFLEHCLEILVDYCNDKDYECYIEPNIPLSLLERRSQLEVLAQKAPVHVGASACSSRVLAACSSRVPPSDGLVERLADALHNVLGFAHAPVQLWNDQGLFRMLFRCASNGREVRARAAARRALVAAATKRCVRVALVATKDCLHDLLVTLTPLTDFSDVTSIHGHAQALLLLGLLLPEKSATDFVWRTLKDKHAVPFFNLILQCLENDNKELLESALFCVTHLFHSSAQRKHSEKSKFAGYIEFFDNLKSRSYSEVNDRRCSGDYIDDCMPEYMAEELTKALICLYNKYSLDNELHYANVESVRESVWVAVSAVTGASARARSLGAHAALPRALLAALARLRDRLAVHGKPVQLIRNADHNPVLRSLYWLLIVMQCSMVECPAAKESFADEGIAISLNRLWPWFMMTEQLRYATAHLLYTFCNDCPKAWSAMCSCVGGRSLAGELCALAAREAALPPRVAPASSPAPPLLHLVLDSLRRCLGHHQCRSIVLKSEAMVSVYKMCMRSGARGGDAGPASGACARAWVALARHAEGAGALLALRPPLALAPRRLRARLLPALAHATHHHPHAFIHSAELLELLSGTLLAGDTAEVVSAARAVWALAANNHKAKLALRSAGIPGAVQTALQRCARAPDAASQRTLQLLTYTNTVLNSS